MEEQNKPEEPMCGTLVRLPLWKNTLEEMLGAGVAYGQTYSAEYFEQRLRSTRDSMQYSLAISEIRRGLEEHGFYLSGRGMKGDQFVILPPESNKDVMASYQRAAMDALKRGVILGTKTRLDTMSAEDRAKHERALEKIALRRVLLHRSESIGKVVKKHSENLLKA